MSTRANRPLLGALLAALLTLSVSPLTAHAAGSTAIPVYPGAVAAVRPAGVGLKHPPPPQAKTYATSDSFTTVKAWYRAHLKGAQEVQQAGLENEDAFLVGDFQSGMVVMIQSYKNKTWIVIGPPV